MGGQNTTNCDLNEVGCMLEYPDCQESNLSSIGDGFCDELVNNEECGFDGGDCCKRSCVGSCFRLNPWNCLDPEYDPFLKCKAPRKWIGNGICNQGTFNKACGWDGGDCHNLQAIWDPGRKTSSFVVGLVVALLLVVVLIVGAVRVKREFQPHSHGDQSRDADEQTSVHEQHSAKTKSEEEEREKMIEYLIVRKVISARSSRGRLSSVCSNLQKSDTVFGSFVSALSGTRRSVEFSDDLVETEIGHCRNDKNVTCHADPSSFPQGESQQLDNNDPESGRVLHDGTESDTCQQEANGGHEEESYHETGGNDRISPNQSNDSREEHEVRRSPRRNRRRSSVVARRISRTIHALVARKHWQNATDCNICLMSYEVGEEVCWSRNPDCPHAFHKECLLDWLLKNPLCPCCRRAYVEKREEKFRRYI